LEGIKPNELIELESQLRDAGYQIKEMTAHLHKGGYESIRYDQEIQSMDEQESVLSDAINDYRIIEDDLRVYC
jgi:hypothetical protein